MTMMTMTTTATATTTTTADTAATSGHDGPHPMVPLRQRVVSREGREEEEIELEEWR